MASVWKHPESSNWFARYRGSEGKTVNRSTGVSDKKEAERIAAAREIEAAREREKRKQGVEISTGGLADALAKAERLARQGRINHASAREILNSILEAAGQQKIDATTHRQWCESWHAGKAGSVTDHTKAKYKKVCDDWLGFLGRKAEQSLETAGKAEAIAFRDQLVRDGLAAPTVNKYLSRLCGAYADAQAQGYIARNPFSDIPTIKDNDKDEAKREPFTADEVSALIRTSEGDWRGLIILAATSGLRMMDAARITWQSLDMEAGLIRIKTSKTGAKLTLPIHPAFSEWLASRTRGIGKAPVFPSLSKMSGTGKLGLSCTFTALMEKAGVSAGVARQAKEDSRGRTTARKSFHSLRHYSASQMAMAGIRSDIARQITGHSDEKVHGVYVTGDLDSLRAAVNAIKLSA